MTIEKFAKLFIKHLRQTGEKRKMFFDPETSFIKVTDDAGRGMYLGHVYSEYCSSPQQDQPNVLRRFARGWFDSLKTIPDEFADVSNDLRPAVRSRLQFEADVLLMQIENKNPPSIPYQPLGEDLAIALVFDLPDTMRNIVQEDLDRWGVTFDEALKVACDNLGKLPCRLEEDDGIYLAVTKDDYDASRLLLLDWIRTFHVKGEFVAMVPTRNVLIVTGSDDTKGLNSMAALVHEALAKLSRRMPGLALRLDGDEWVSWMPDSSHPTYQCFRGLQVSSYCNNYNLQTELLDKLHKAKNENLYVSPLGFGQDAGEILTYNAWQRGVPTLLPRADRVGFVGEDEEVPMIAWDRVMETVGYMMEPVEMYPARWRVADFPSEQEMATMRDAET